MFLERNFIELHIISRAKYAISHSRNTFEKLKQHDISISAIKKFIQFDIVFRFPTSAEKTFSIVNIVHMFGLFLLMFKYFLWKHIPKWKTFFPLHMHEYYKCKPKVKPLIWASKSVSDSTQRQRGKLDFRERYKRPKIAIVFARG